MFFCLAPLCYLELDDDLDRDLDLDPDDPESDEYFLLWLFFFLWFFFFFNFFSFLSFSFLGYEGGSSLIPNLSISIYPL